MNLGEVKDSKGDWRPATPADFDPSLLAQVAMESAEVRHIRLAEELVEVEEKRALRGEI